MNKNKKILFAIATVFTLVVMFIAYDMASRTTPPWKKRKDTFNKYKIDHFKKKI